MNLFTSILTVIHLVTAIITAIVVLVLLQQGKGADMGAAFSCPGEGHHSLYSGVVDRLIS